MGEQVESDYDRGNEFGDLNYILRVEGKQIVPKQRQQQLLMDGEIKEEWKRMWVIKVMIHKAPKISGCQNQKVF